MERIVTIERMQPRATTQASAAPVDLAATGERARRALAEAERRGLPPDPRVFELFFAYLGGEDARLRAAVDAMLPEGGGANMDAVDRLHEAHLALGGQAERFLDVGRQVELELATNMYTAAQASLEAAKAEARRTQRYLATHIAPTLAQEAEYPRRIVWTLAVFVGLLLTWSIALLIVGSIRDRN